ncbi:hypothetical protein JTE90_006489 [Oedothorax gibbosus]|uniref:Uncharacterized protein n=1 Tax=Oedothorax gibbosus TaxID=931172 RepID=A0AAV6VMB5_9ARAC|nr:hypothetical protein JTE90_006489 [Oedothorax gibbosus]
MMDTLDLEDDRSYINDLQRSKLAFNLLDSPYLEGANPYQSTAIAVKKESWLRRFFDACSCYRKSKVKEEEKSEAYISFNPNFNPCPSIGSTDGPKKRKTDMFKEEKSDLNFFKDIFY